MKRLALVSTLALLVLAGLATLAWRWWLGPDPEEILARLEVPPAPALSPEKALASLAVAPGFRVELVAAEPHVVDPVAIDWDDAGRLYAVEMRGYMPDLEGRGEDRPVGRVVVLTDRDGDGRVDESRVLLDGLVMPRAVAVLPEGVLVGAPPDLWLCPPPADPPRCDAPLRLSDYGGPGRNPESRESALLAGLDGWIYNSGSTRRFRLRDGRLEIAPAQQRSQWGLAQDDAGRLYSNHNSGFVYADVFPAEYTLRQPATAASPRKPGVAVGLTGGEEVHGVRVAAGLNRAYLRGSLRADGRQRGPTAVSGIAIQRGDQFGPEFAGDAFVPEAAGGVVAHFRLERGATELSAEHRLYPDETWGRREFLASSDERFRPVDAEIGPDGALWVIDMYRGVIQHAAYVSEYLREYVKRQDLEAPGATGRIWRVVREDRPIARRPPPLASVAEQLAALDHPNGWVRDRAQLRLVHEARPGALAALRALGSFGPLGRRHALWALHGAGALDVATWRRALADPDPVIRRIALRAGESLYGRPDVDALGSVLPLLEDPDAGVRLQTLHSLGSLPRDVRPLERLLAAGRAGDALLEQAALSGLAGLEMAALRSELDRAGADGAGDVPLPWLESLAMAAHASARQGPDAASRVALLLDLADALEGPQQLAVLTGIETAQRLPGSQRFELAARHALFDPERPAAGELGTALLRLRGSLTWPGDARPGGARPLTAAEEQRSAAGRERFAQRCAACHGDHGRGIADVAPSLVGSPWVRDSEEWLLRIVLGGLHGPIHIDGERWDGHMPGHAADPSLDDEALAGLATWLRRAWGHAEEPVTPGSVARVRAALAGRAQPFTVDELLELPVAHRLDRYTGIYRIPVVGLELQVRVREGELVMGQRGGGVSALDEAGDGVFLGPEISLHFELDASGAVAAVRADYAGNRIPLTRVE